MIISRFILGSMGSTVMFETEMGWAVMFGKSNLELILFISRFILGSEFSTVMFQTQMGWAVMFGTDKYT